MCCIVFVPEGKLYLLVKTGRMSNVTPIPQWQNFDKPRNKMIQIGPKLMSTSELLAMLINSGNRNESALDISRRLLSETDDGLNGLAESDYSTLIGYAGIGKAKACQLLAMFELANRMQGTSEQPKPKIQSSAQAYREMRSLFAQQKFEQFWLLLLNRGNRLIRKVQISDGGVFETTVDPIKVFKSAIDACATGVILFHNHPSNNLEPSSSDLQLTKRLIEGGKILNISVLDHIIVGAKSYFSFKDESLIL
jgi:DNA repair protein RadC